MSNNKKNKDDDLKALESLENESKNNNSIEEENDFDSNLAIVGKDAPNTLDGYKVLDRSEIPQNGVLYPESWAFAYRCPTGIEVANFSTINEQDQPAIVIAIEDLIKKCVVIYDTARQRRVSSGEINDAHRTFFLLKLREFYLPGAPINYQIICSLCHEQLPVDLLAHKLKYPELTEKLINSFDGRKFVLDMELDEPIEFLIPTIEISSRIFKYVIRVYRDGANDKERKEDKIVYDKQFLLFAPYLYETGKETIKELSKKYNEIKSDEKRFKAYLEIINKLSLEHLDNVDVNCICGSEEEAPIRFPGGWKAMFVSKSSPKGYFN